MSKETVITEMNIVPCNTKNGEHKITFTKVTTETVEFYIDRDGGGSMPEEYWDTDLEKRLTKLVKTLCDYKDPE